MSKLRIQSSIIREINVEKSRFIAILLPLETAESTRELLALYKKEYPKARHYPYAYIFDQTSQSSDDGEPSGTAGRPLLQLLLNHELNRVLVIVVRYFGGIKLGAGRLLRTYVEAANLAIKEATFLQEVSGYYYEYQFDYRDGQIIQNKIAISPEITYEIDYTNNVKIKITSPRPLAEMINSWLQKEVVPELEEERLILLPVTKTAAN